MNTHIFSFLNKKRIIISIISIVSIVFILISLAIGVYFIKFRQNTSPIEAAGVNLRLASVNTTVNKGDEFLVDVFMNTKGLSVTGADLRINYDKSKLEAISIESKNYLPVVFIPGSVTQNQGKARIVLGCNPTEPKVGTGIIAAVKFKAKVQGVTTEISFDDTTVVAALGQTTDVLNKPTTPLTITILSLATATPTATSTGDPTPTATSIATPTATSTGDPTPTATGSTVPGDVNSDNKVNILDLGIIFSPDIYRLEASAYPSADLNNDGWINMLDAMIVLNNYESWEN